MVNASFFDIFGVIGFVILLYVGLKLSKYKTKKIKITGYVVLGVSLVGLIVDLYTVTYNYLLR